MALVLIVISSLLQFVTASLALYVNFHGRKPDKPIRTILVFGMVIALTSSGIVGWSNYWTSVSEQDAADQQRLILSQIQHAIGISKTNYEQEKDLKDELASITSEVSAIEKRTGVVIKKVDQESDSEHKSEKYQHKEFIQVIKYVYITQKNTGDTKSATSTIQKTLDQQAIRQKLQQWSVFHPDNGVYEVSMSFPSNSPYFKSYMEWYEQRKTIRDLNHIPGQLISTEYVGSGGYPLKNIRACDNLLDLLNKCANWQISYSGPSQGSLSGQPPTWNEFLICPNWYNDDQIIVNERTRQITVKTICLSREDLPNYNYARHRKHFQTITPAPVSGSPTLDTMNGWRTIIQSNAGSDLMLPAPDKVQLTIGTAFSEGPTSHVDNVTGSRELPLSFLTRANGPATYYWTGTLNLL